MPDSAETIALKQSWHLLEQYQKIIILLASKLATVDLIKTEPLASPYRKGICYLLPDSDEIEAFMTNVDFIEADRDILKLQDLLTVVYKKDGTETKLPYEYKLKDGFTEPLQDETTQ